MNPPIAADFAPRALLAAARAEGRPIDLSRVTAHTDGWENVVLETADGLMLRFPRDEDVEFDRELRLLDRLHDRLPVRIPVIEWTGARTRFAAYRKLTGFAFDRDAYLAASGWQRELLAGSLARFLAAVHESLSAAEIAELELPVLDHQPTLDLVVREMRWLPAQQWKAVEGLIAEFAATWVAGFEPRPTLVLHNDFHPGNMVFAEPVGELSGLWDFSNVVLGAPDFDFRYLDGAPRDLLERVAGHYQMLTKRVVDVRAAVVANRMEDLFDVLEARRTDLFDSRVARWVKADQGR